MTRVWAACAALVLAACVSATDAQSASAEIDLTYTITIGGRAVPNGAVWLYLYGHGYIDYGMLGSISNGRLQFRLTPDLVRQDIRDRPSNRPTFVVAIETPDGWYRSPDFQDFMQETVSFFERIGRSTRAAGARRIDLPGPVRQTFRVLNADGTPRANQSLRVETYVSSDNHCAVHMGFEGGGQTIVSDRNGVATLVAPLAELYVSTAFYTEIRADRGPALSPRSGERLDAGPVHVLRHTWGRAAERTLTVRLLDENDRPRPGGIIVLEHWSCGGSDSYEFQSIGANQVITATFAPEHADEVCVMQNDEYNPGDPDACLSDVELRQLYTAGTLTLHWPRPPRDWVRRPSRGSSPRLCSRR